MTNIRKELIGHYSRVLRMHEDAQSDNELKAFFELEEVTYSEKYKTPWFTRMSRSTFENLKISRFDDKPSHSGPI